jgi:hypothetical protein
MDKKEFIRRLANSLVANSKTITGIELANHLNLNNYKTNTGSLYEGKRGTYRLVTATYDWLDAFGLQNEANNVALAFKKPNGEYAYNKKRKSI